MKRQPPVTWSYAILIAAALASVAQTAPPPADAPVSSALTGPERPEDNPAALKAQVADLLHRLASPEFKERQKAQADVADLPFQAADHRRLRRPGRRSRGARPPQGSAAGV